MGESESRLPAARKGGGLEHTLPLWVYATATSATASSHKEARDRAAIASTPYKQRSQPFQALASQVRSVPQQSSDAIKPHPCMFPSDSLPLTELTVGQVISLQGRAGQFNDVPVLNAGWLNGVMSKAEWQADIASINAAARCATAPTGSTLSGDEAVSDDTAIPAILANGRERFGLVRCDQPSYTFAHRIFIWFEDGALGSADPKGTLYWNEYGPERVKSAGNCVRIAHLETNPEPGERRLIDPDSHPFPFLYLLQHE